MNNIAGQKTPLIWAIHFSLGLLVLIWLFPTAGLLVSSFRTADQISSSGWWSSLFATTQNFTLRTAKPETQQKVDGLYTIKGDLFADKEGIDIQSWGVSSRDINAFQIGETASLRKGGRIQLFSDGTYVLENEVPFTGSRGVRVFVTATTPPEFTLDNYHYILFDPSHSQGMGQAFLNTLTVAIPSTIIPILIAAFAAYALAWMEFPGRLLIVSTVVGFLVVPLQLALIPILKLHNDIGIGKGYVGIWLVHSAFGLPMAIYLLRNYMAGLPKDIIENARVDGASEFLIFRKIILPLSFPALASYAIFQFLWTWNDLLVAKVFLIDATGETNVMTNKVVEMLGTLGGNWEILSTSAFISIAVPLLVFFTMQKYLVRGLLSGSVK